MTEKHFTIDVEENTQENALFEDDKFVCFEDDTDEYLKKINEMSDEIEQLKQTVSDWSGSYDELFEDVKRLEEENRQLKYQNELLSDELEQCKAVINNKWSEYLKKKELEND